MTPTAYPRRVHGPCGFTLTELLAVIAIVGILAAIILVAIGSVRAQAETARCGSNIRQLQSLALLWAKDNHDWVPQAMWSYQNIGKQRAGATNLWAVGYTPSIGTGVPSTTPAPNFGINNQLVSGGPDGQWGASGPNGPDPQYWEHGRYKYSAVQSARTIFFTETAKTSGYGSSGAYMSAPATLGYFHGGKCYVAFADGHVDLKPSSFFAAASVWTDGITH